MTDPILSGIYPNLRAIFGMINIWELSENPGKEIQSFYKCILRWRNMLTRETGSKAYSCEEFDSH